MSRKVRIALIGAGLAVGLVAIVALWSLDYALAYFVIYRRWDMLNAVVNNHDWLLPAEQVWTNLGRAELSRVVNLSLMALMVEVAGIGGVIAYLAEERRRRLGPSDGARFATLADLRKANLLNGVVGYSVLLGRFEGKDVRYSGDSHFFVNGPSRSGKGRGFVMTNLLQWRGSVIVLDVKLENYLLTGAARSAMGQQIIVIAPGSEASYCWNPLDFVRPWPTRATDVMNMAAALIEEPDRGEKFWAQTARGLLAGLLAYVLESPSMEGRRTMRSVQRLLVPELNLAATMKAILEIEPKLSTFVKEAFRGFLNGDEKQRKSFSQTADTSVQAWKNQLIADVTAKSDFDIRDFRRKGMTVYIAAPVSDFATVEPLIRLFIQQIHDLSLRELPKPDEKLKVLLVLDEFYQFKRLPEVVRRAPLVGGYGFRIAVLAQNLPQIDEQYSKVTREAFLGNMDVKLFIAANDDTTAEAISRDLGRKYVKRESISQRVGFGSGSSVTRTSTWAETQLLSPDNIKRLSDEKTILLVRGHPGAILDKLNFYEDPEFTAVVDDAAALKSMLKIPRVEEVVEWPLFDPVPAGVTVPGNPLLNKVKKEGLAWGKENEKLWREIVGAARRVFQDPIVYLNQLEEAMSAPDSDAVAWIAQKLRTTPEVCGALRGKAGLYRSLADRDRKDALAAVSGLRLAIMAMRRRINEERSGQFAAQAAVLQTAGQLRSPKSEPAAQSPVSAVATIAQPPVPAPPASGGGQSGALSREIANAPGGNAGAAGHVPVDEPVVAAAAGAARSLTTAFAAVVDRAVQTVVDGGTLQSLTSMRDRIKRRAEAFASNADSADMIPDDLMPER